jgi:hypothetical protein
MLHISVGNEGFTAGCCLTYFINLLSSDTLQPEKSFDILFDRLDNVLYSIRNVKIPIDSKFH